KTKSSIGAYTSPMRTSAFRVPFATRFARASAAARSFTSVRITCPPWERCAATIPITRYPHPRSMIDSQGPTWIASRRSSVPRSSPSRENTLESARKRNGRPRIVTRIRAHLRADAGRVSKPCPPLPATGVAQRGIGGVGMEPFPLEPPIQGLRVGERRRRLTIVFRDGLHVVLQPRGHGRGRFNESAVEHVASHLHLGLDLVGQDAFAS